MLPLRVCSVCKVAKPENEDHFGKHTSCRSGLDTGCKTCRGRQRTEWKRRHKDRVNARQRELYALTNGEKHKARVTARWERYPYKVTAENLFKGIYERARTRQLEVAPELRTTAFIEAWLRKQPACECCGVHFQFGPKDGRPCDNSPSFDRFDAASGYTLKNTKLICWRCNNIKRNYSAEDLRRVASWISSYGNETSKFGEAA